MDLRILFTALTMQIGPVLVSAALVPDVTKLQIRGLKNGRVMQDCPLTYVTLNSPNQTL